MKRALAVAAGAGLALSLGSGVAQAKPSLEDKIESPACHGAIVSALTSNGITTPGKAAKWININIELEEKFTAGDLHKLITLVCEAINEE